MTENSKSIQKGQIMGRTSQIIAAAVSIAIMLPVMMYAYGQSISTLEELFTFSAANIFVKTLLGAAMLILVFFYRPRSEYLRMTLGTIASIALAYSAYGAFSGSLALGDAVLYILGIFIAMNETFEADFPRRTHQPASKLHHRPPALKV